MRMTLAECAWALGGSLAGGAAATPGGTALTRTVESLAVDSRQVRPDGVFVALPGARVDGHQFVGAALAAGAAAVVVSRAQWQSRTAELAALARDHAAAIIIVANTLAALQQLGRVHRARHESVLRIAITGSNGKTTTRHILASILARSARTYEPERNYNSDIGLPLAICGISAEHRIAVLELGIDHLGEMDELGDICRPHHALITSIGSAHVGPLQSRARIAAEKARVFHYLREGGLAFVPEGEPLLSDAAIGRPAQRFGTTTTHGYEGSEHLGLGGSRIHWEGLQIHFPLFGNHNVTNVLAAITVASTLGITAAAIQEGIEAVRPIPGRAEVLHGRLTIINDAYNANPESMAAALEYLSSLHRSGRVLVVLGSMLELGAAADEAHRVLGELVAELELDAVFLFGAELEPAYAVLRERGFRGPCQWTLDFTDLSRAVLAEVRERDTVMLKGSRAMALDRLVPMLQAA